MKLSEIVSEECNLVRDGEFEILAQCTIANNRDILTFLEDLRYLHYINENKSIKCLICRYEHINLITNKSIGIICVQEPRLFFFQTHNKLVNNYRQRNQNNKITIGEKCCISPLASISPSNVIIGNNVIIEDFVSIKENVVIGNNCIIRSGSIIGGQGYEFKRNKKESIFRVYHAGMIVIENDVEIKEVCTIHKAVFDWDNTKIGEYSKLDAHTHIGHATKLGKRVMVGSHCNIAGNVCVDDDVYIGPGSTISNRINLKSGAKITIGSVVTKDVLENNVVTGNFAIEHEIFIQDLKEKIAPKTSYSSHFK